MGGLAMALPINTVQVSRFGEHSGQRRVVLKARSTYTLYENCAPVPFTSSVLVLLLSSGLGVPSESPMAPLRKVSRQ